MRSEDNKPRGERVLQGLAVSPGIAIGPAFVSDEGHIAVPEYRLAPDKIEAEQERFADAVAASLKQLRKL